MRSLIPRIVGASIVLSLIGRGEISHMIGEVPPATERVKAFRETAGLELSRAEKARALARRRGK